MEGISFSIEELGLTLLSTEDLIETDGGGWAYDAGRAFMTWYLDVLPYYKPTPGSVTSYHP